MDDGLIEGTIYTIRWIAINDKGQSLPSDEILVLLEDYPAAPTTVTKVSELSSRNSIALEWSASTSANEILGYVLTVTNVNLGITWTAFDGYSLGLYDKLDFSIYGLNTGDDYLFSVQAVNFNGLGPAS